MTVTDHRQAAVSRSRMGVTTAAIAGGVVLFGAVSTGPAWATPTAISPVTVTYTDAGEHVFAVPAGVTSIHVVAIGGKGGGGFAPGGAGARAEGDLTVTPGQTLYAEVAGDGAPASQTVGAWAHGGVYGGGNGGRYNDAQYDASHGFLPVSGGGGGGASDVRTCSIGVGNCAYSLPSMLLVAAGGGGAGADSAGGAGGTPIGKDAVATKNGSGAGTGATTSLWGYGGFNPFLGIGGHSGDSGVGGNGGEGVSYGGGGGGAGYYGGGGGAGGYSDAAHVLAGGGGGGSSHGPDGTVYSNTSDPTSLTITYVPVPGPAPSIQAPTIVGVPRVGSTLTAVANSNAPEGGSYTNQWLRDGTAITGATQATYVPVASDVGHQLSVRATITLPGHTDATATSTAVTVALGAALKTTTAPSITGVLKVGHTLTAKHGTWTPAATSYSYQWRRDGKAITGATNATYKAAKADKGHTLSVKITAKRSGYTNGTATSKAVKIS
jgi:hypothetical protein